MRNRLIVMVKEPRPGHVKTRLGQGIGFVTAAWWYRHQVRRLLRRLADPRWQLVVAVTPDCEGLQSRVWPAGLTRVAQGQGDLGARMGRLLRSGPSGRTCLIGSDIPGITRAHIDSAFRALGRGDAVLGPSDDGGYWLIGVRHGHVLPRHAFQDVRWSTRYARSDTERSLSGLRIDHVAQLRDVDTKADL